MLNTLGPLLRAELHALQNTPSFGEYTDNDIEHLEESIAAATNVVQEKAPTLISVIHAATKDKRGDGKTTNDRPIDGRCVIIAAIFGNIIHRNKFETIQVY